MRGLFCLLMNKKPLRRDAIVAAAACEAYGCALRKRIYFVHLRTTTTRTATAIILV